MLGQKLSNQNRMDRVSRSKLWYILMRSWPAPRSSVFTFLLSTMDPLALAHGKGCKKGQPPWLQRKPTSLSWLCNFCTIFLSLTRRRYLCFFFLQIKGSKVQTNTIDFNFSEKKKKQNYCPLLLLPTMCSLPIELSSSHFGPLITTTKQTKLKGVQNNNNNNIKGCGRITI